MERLLECHLPHRLPRHRHRQAQAAGCAAGKRNPAHIPSPVSRDIAFKVYQPAWSRRSRSSQRSLFTPSTATPCRTPAPHRYRPRLFKGRSRRRGRRGHGGRLPARGPVASPSSPWRMAARHGGGHGRRHGEADHRPRARSSDALSTPPTPVMTRVGWRSSRWPRPAACPCSTAASAIP